MLTGCGGEPSRAPVREPADAPRRLFALAALPEPPVDALGAVFALPSDEAERAKLLDTLGALPEPTEVRVDAVEFPAGPGDAFVDVTASLPGGGQSRLTLRVARAQDGPWRIVWLRGPGVEWPAGGRARGTGLSSSSPPRTGD